MIHNKITILGARENNLKNVSISIPKGKLVVFTGVSGSGKSSLAFNTIATEAMRRLNDTYPLYIRNRMPHYAIPKVEVIEGLTTTIVIEQKMFGGDSRSTVGTMTDISPMLRVLYSRCAVPSAGTSNTYSFNDSAGMCKACGGLGKKIEFDFEKLLDKNKSLNEGAILFPGHQIGTYQWQLYANSGLFNPDKPLNKFSDIEWEDFLHGSGTVVEITNTTGKVWDKSYNLTYEGFLDRITRLYLNRDLSKQSKANQRIIQQFTSEHKCKICNGARLNEKALESRLFGYNIAELGEMEICDVIKVLRKIDDPVGTSAARNIIRILEDIIDIGIGYLSLNRSSNTLSGGEAQRLKMVKHLRSGLVGITYIFDEPSVGLHPKDIQKMNRLLIGLRDKGNTVLVVEHDEEIIRIADEVIDMGPGAGKNGGEVVFQGKIQELLRADTITAKWLQQRVPVNTSPRKARGEIRIENATLHNLKNVSVHIPKGVMTVVCGLAGSGKSSLVCGELVCQLPETIHISQAPIGTTSRSTPATYIGIMEEIRKLFAKSNNVSASIFSFNSNGACPVCGGKGIVTTDMAFMDPVTSVCESCGGKRYSEYALGFCYNGKNILEVLEMTVCEASIFFEGTKIKSKLQLLEDVGMEYITLGQPTSTLSGGECQRLKLASHLKSKNKVYVMDEPTTGLHGQDIKLLMNLIDCLVDSGNTVIVVEHNIDIVKQADWVIEMGPGGGENGGEVLFYGTPQQLADFPDSPTAEYLRQDIRL